MNDAFRYVDELGPEKIIELYDPHSGLKAVVVVDNVATGPSIGGTRMAEDVSTNECVRLARAMTLKNAMAGLPHGGGKSVIQADPHMAPEAKKHLIRSFAHAIKDIADYIPGPDMGTNEQCMAQIQDVIHRAVGLPKNLGGIPLDEIGATGFGVTVAIETAQPYLDFNLSDARVVIQGFGSVGMHAARFLAERGARLVGVSDSNGARVAPDGFDLPRLVQFKASGQKVADFDQGEALAPEDLIAVECDVWIPAARPDVIHEGNVRNMRTKIVCQGANIPATLAAERLLAERGILVIPDFVANAGGVICAAVEYAGGTESQALASIEQKIRHNVSTLLAQTRETGELPRDAALGIAHDRVLTAMQSRTTY